jgi:hypothetical protein
MPPTNRSKRIFLAPVPRAVSDIFEASDLIRLRAIGDLVVREDGPITDQLFEAHAAESEIIIGQFEQTRTTRDRGHVSQQARQQDIVISVQSAAVDWKASGSPLVKFPSH